MVKENSERSRRDGQMTTFLNGFAISKTWDLSVYCKNNILNLKIFT